MTKKKRKHKLVPFLFSGKRGMVRMRKKLRIITVFLFGLIIGLFLIPEIFQTFDISFFSFFD